MLVAIMAATAWTASGVLWQHICLLFVDALGARLYQKHYMWLAADARHMRKGIGEHKAIAPKYLDCLLLSPRHPLHPGTDVLEFRCSDIWIMLVGRGVSLYQHRQRRDVDEPALPPQKRLEAPLVRRHYVSSTPIG